MRTESLIRKEIDSLPKNLQYEVLDYIHFLRDREPAGKSEAELLKEKILKSGWFMPDKDELQGH
ncbi:MAG: hypothetical protein A2Y33_12800 [Spirochaetes bacterium GWF1_51_8]|nr:MAG: hypothetical protein A2Y33_12800 [Spirochaetes bacterium GWF1_51_8]